MLTDAAGGLTEGMSVGEPVLISDHLNTTGMRSPLVGAEFVNMVDAYAPRLRKIVKGQKGLRPGMREAVYAMTPGPQYETPAEIHMLRTCGAGLVGMFDGLRDHRRARRRRGGPGHLPGHEPGRRGDR